MEKEKFEESVNWNSFHLFFETENEPKDLYALVRWYFDINYGDA